MAVAGIGSTYGGLYESAYASSSKDVAKKEEAKKTEIAGKQTGDLGKSSNEEYLKSLQKQVPYVKLETGFALNMKKDNRAGVITVNPKLLEKMQNDPEAAKKYTQTLKDIERAEKTGDAYFNALGGVVEMTSHWYVDENGNFTHFAYVHRDDKLNKKIRKEALEKAEELIEKTREKAVKARKEQQKAAAQKLEEKKEEKASESVGGKEGAYKAKGAASHYGENIIVEFFKDGMEALAQKKESAASGLKKPN